MPRTAQSGFFKGGNGQRRRGANGRTNTNCKECNTLLLKSEGEICDSCRLAKLGWKKIDAVPHQLG